MSQGESGDGSLTHFTFWSESENRPLTHLHLNNFYPNAKIINNDNLEGLK